MAVSNPYKQYKKTQIDGADQGKLILMLYDGAIKFINKALELIEEKSPGNIENIHNNIVKAQDIITELMSSLNMDAGDLAQRLFSIYMYMNNRLIEANINKNAEPLNEVKNYLMELKGAWQEASKTVASEEYPRAREEGVNIAT